MGQEPRGRGKILLWAAECCPTERERASGSQPCGSCLCSALSSWRCSGEQQGCPSLEDHPRTVSAVGASALLGPALRGLAVSAFALSESSAVGADGIPDGLLRSRHPSPNSPLRPPHALPTWSGRCCEEEPSTSGNSGNPGQLDHVLTGIPYPLSAIQDGGFHSCCRDLHQPCEDLGEASAMKILYLLFPFFLLLIQGAAGNEAQCRRRGGFCTIGGCRFPTTPIGRCSSYRHCCRSIWG
ncbi:gallinacin-3 precursor [Patagioenas fasciata monilis]|uniref:Gallinacin-3 n=1 Tax=Patagioenas fasciata monilis TaxID=372326 RepID=A0A1V4JVB1_PATFA|nr:gallinacin-3 precursor [Patagioenas fasciata monilis]